MSDFQLPYTKKELFGAWEPKKYEGRSLTEIAFPLGGIGTGMISLGGWGQLRDWEIMNRPAKGRTMPDAFFSVRIEEGRKKPVVKVLQGPSQGSYNLGGHSARRDSGEGLPHFRSCNFRGEYPFAVVEMEDSEVDLKVNLVAFNPTIPLNEKDSGIPGAIFLYSFRNTSKNKMKLTVMGNLCNIIGDDEGRTNEIKRTRGLTSLVLSTTAYETDEPPFGSIALTTPAPDAWVWPHWNDDRINKFWEAVTSEKTFPPKKKGSGIHGTIGAQITLEPGEMAMVPFILTWYFPNYEHWNCPEGEKYGATWKNWYATQWDSAWDVANYTWQNFEQLYNDTHKYHQALFSSTIPGVALDAVSSQISILKTPTCLRLTDGTFYGFEGCSDGCGCCEGSCTHVWNYAQALPYLYPKLQQSMREADWNNSMVDDDGFVCFRMPLPIGTSASDSFHPAADGQLGTVIQVYREWLISGDDEWLQNIWPKAKKALEFAWEYWDADKDGVMEGLQHNTYDMEWWGANTMCGSLYLGALRAAEELANYLGETEKAEEYRKVFESGSKLTDAKQWNGDYYEQIVNPRANANWPEHLANVNMAGGGKDDIFPDWPRWQFGKGCLSDQLLGQWYAEMLGLGYLYDKRKVKKTLQSIFKYNWRADLSDHFCSLRVYALNDEAGLLIATWPKGERPGYPFWFCDEVWCGIEYQVASHLIYEGLVAEGLSIVKGVRDRHTGKHRNPWDEFECGHHYARSMASYGVLTALSGFSYSAPAKRIGFAPRVHKNDFKVFFSVASGWGTYAQRIKTESIEIDIAVEYGDLTLQELDIDFKPGKLLQACFDSQCIDLEVKKHGDSWRISFNQEVIIPAGQCLTITGR